MQLRHEMLGSLFVLVAIILVVNSNSKASNFTPASPLVVHEINPCELTITYMSLFSSAS